MSEEYSNFPPLSILKTVLQNKPRAAYVLIKLWKFYKVLKLKKIVVNKDRIRQQFGISQTLFKNHIYSLSYLNVILYTESLEKIIIHLREELCE